MRSLPRVVTRRIRVAELAADRTDGRKKKPTKAQTRVLGQRIGRLQRKLHAGRAKAVLLIFEGMDCSGKDGTIRHVLRDADPAGFAIAYFKAPTEEEKAHDFLWRAHRVVPPRGVMGCFNRSYYEAVLVERVMLGVSSATCRRRYRQIVAFERMLAENDILVLKFFLHLSRREQGRRLRERVTDRRKQWKFDREDLRARRHWPGFMRAYEEMINSTSHSAARWLIVPADHKWFRNHVVAATVAEALRQLRPKWPRPKEDIAPKRIK